MKITFAKENGALTVILEGRLDTTTAPEFETFLNTNVNGVESLTVNCEKLAYVSSAGLRVLLGAHKKMKGAIKLVGVQELVMEVFEMTGFADIFAIEQ